MPCMKMLSLKPIYFITCAVVYIAMLGIGTSPGAVAKVAPIANDKVLHGTAYAGYALLLALGWRHSAGAALKVLGAIALMGLLDELHQIPLAFRTADIWDWVADVIAGCVVVAAFSLLDKKKAA